MLELLVSFLIIAIRIGEERIEIRMFGNFQSRGWLEILRQEGALWPFRCNAKAMLRVKEY